MRHTGWLVRAGTEAYAIRSWSRPLLLAPHSILVRTASKPKMVEASSSFPDFRDKTRGCSLIVKSTIYALCGFCFVVAIGPQSFAAPADRPPVTSSPYTQPKPPPAFIPPIFQLPPQQRERELLRRDCLSLCQNTFSACWLRCGLYRTNPYAYNRCLSQCRLSFDSCRSEC